MLGARNASRRAWGAQQKGIALSCGVAPAHGRGDPRQRADRIDSEILTLLVDERPHFFFRQSKLRLREKRSGQSQNLVALTQFLDLAFERLNALTLGIRYAIAYVSIDFVFLESLKERHC